jgi:hypothetical protein
VTQKINYHNNLGCVWLESGVDGAAPSLFYVCLFGGDLERSGFRKRISPQYSEQDCSLKSVGLMARERRDFFFAQVNGELSSVVLPHRAATCFRPPLGIASPHPLALLHPAPPTLSSIQHLVIPARRAPKCGSTHHIYSKAISSSPPPTLSSLHSPAHTPALAQLLEATGKKSTQPKRGRSGSILFWLSNQTKIKQLCSLF